MSAIQRHHAAQPGCAELLCSTAGTAGGAPRPRHRAGASLSAGHVSFGDILPVDYVPDSLQVVGSDILVLKVVSVLPHVDPQKWNKTYWEEETK